MVGGGGSPCLSNERFLLIFRGEPGASFTKVGSNRTNFNLSD